MRITEILDYINREHTKINPIRLEDYKYIDISDPDIKKLRKSRREGK